MPKVSVIIPVFNRFSFLPEAVESVISQTLHEVELIVVDDGSESDINTVLDKYPNVILVKQKNMGMASARNVGVLHSTGDYIAFLDSDDYWKPDKLRRQVELMESQPDLGACYTRFSLVGADGTLLGYTKPIVGYTTYVDLLGNFTMSPSSTMVRRALFHRLGGFDPLEIHASDMDLFLKFALFSKVGFIEESLAYYRVHDSNLHSNTFEMLPSAFAMFDKHIAYAKSVGDKEILRAALAGRNWVRAEAGQHLVTTARDCLYRGQLVKTVYYSLQAAITARSFRPHLERVLLLLKNLIPSSKPADLQVLGMMSESEEVKAAPR